MSLMIDHIHKWFRDFHVIDDLSLEIKQGTPFGFLGPNGAGKTTTMRMILDIFRPDQGQITWNGAPVEESPRSQWGYLPEERGLYPKMEVGEQLLFLAQLYGLSRPEALRQLSLWLERFQISAYRKTKVEELSKGNQQKVQFLAAILHKPEILIMDEPFSALDPINANLLKDAFHDLNAQGKTIIFSTHQLEDVEELCEDILLINKGKCLVQGSIDDIKRQYGRHMARIKLDNDPQATFLDDLEGVQITSRRQDYIEMYLPASFDPNRIVQAALQHGRAINRFELVEPSLTDIFIDQVKASEATS